MVSGKLPVRYACASASSRSETRSRCSRQNSSTISRSASPVVSDRVSVSATKSPASLQRVDVGRRAVGEAALGSQHAVQAVAAFAAEDLDREVERHVVRVLARQRRCCRRGSRSAPRPACRRRRRGASAAAARRGVGAGSSAPSPSCRTRARRRRTPRRRSRRRRWRGWRCSAPNQRLVERAGDRRA